MLHWAQKILLCVFLLSEKELFLLLWKWFLMLLSNFFNAFKKYHHNQNTIYFFFYIFTYIFKRVMKRVSVLSWIEMWPLLSLLARVSFLTWPSSPACLQSQASAPGSKACSASTERKDATLTYCLSKNGGRWNWPQTQHQEPLQQRPSANWSEQANGCILSACPTFWSLPWCASARGTFTGRRGEAMPSTPSQTFTCRMALPCGESTGLLTLAPRVWPTHAA